MMAKNSVTWECDLAETTDGRVRGKRRWVSVVPYGLHQQHPNAYKDILATIWENRDNLRYAYRILRDGCCDGCSLGTSGMRDWTMEGIHLCAVRLSLLRLNSMPAMDWRALADVSALRKLSGRQLRKLGRLAVPMVRHKGDKGFHGVSWNEALELAAKRLKATDSTRMAWFLTSRGLTNEAYYAHAKVARWFGTNHVDTSARTCHAPSTLALSETVGCAATTCSYSDWMSSELIIFIGSNIASNQPVAMKYLYYAKKRGTKVFLVNPYFEPGLERYWVPSVAQSAMFGTRFADDYFQIHVGGDIAFFYGVLKHMIENGWLDREFIRTRTAGFDEVEERVNGFSWKTLERSAGQTQGEMYRFAEAFGKAKSAIAVWSMGITQHRHGSDNVRAIVNLQLAKGNVGRPGTGLMPIRGHSGVQGGAEMGAQPGAYLTGHAVSVENGKKFATPECWGFEPPAWKGLTSTHMILAAERGEIDALWQSGGNFVETLPEPERARSAVAKIKLRIHQDILVSSNMLVEPAETVILFPSKTRYEQHGGGTETSTERRVIYSPEIPGPRVPEARDEWEIPVNVVQKADAEAAAKFFNWGDTQDIRNEIERLCPTYKGVANLHKKGDNFQYGGPRLLADRFLTPDGKGHFTAVSLPENEVPEGQFLLSTRRGKQFNSMVHADHDPLTGANREDVLMAREDARRLGLGDGDGILLRNECGEFRGRVKIGRIKPGCVQGHWPEVNVCLPSGRLDASGVPDYNAAVEVIANFAGEKGSRDGAKWHAATNAND